ncbi:MAG: hypothetical protein Q8N53_01525 [Longimicrobiales bacterium]|nr:hypothetical protein [Longimicrobiales bacterium]
MSPPSSSTSTCRTGPHTLSPARGPPQGDLLLDQTPVFDPVEAEPEQDFQFDQSLPAGLDD